MSSVSFDQRLTCDTILSPPPQQIGQGADRLVYANRQPAWQCTFSRDGVYLAVCYGAPDPCIRIWKKQEEPMNDELSSSSTTTWQLDTTLEGIHTRTIRSVAFAPINRPLILASASFDGTVAIWEQPSDSGSGLNTATTDWDCIAQLEGHDNEVKCVVWNATGSLLATSGRDKTVWIWECFLPGTVGGSDGDGDFECIAVLHGHEADVKCVKFTASHDQWGDGDEICLSASYDDTIRIWAEDAGDWYCAACIQGVHTSTVWTLDVAPSGTRLISGSADGSLAIYKCYSALELKKLAANETDDNTNNHAAWKCVGKLPDAHHSMTVYSVACAPARVGHGRIASGGADNCVHIYREVLCNSSSTTATNRHQPMFELDAAVTVAGSGDVNCVCWHPWEGSVLASAGDDGKVRIWNYKV